MNADQVTPSTPVALMPDEVALTKWGEEQVASSHERASTAAGLMAALSLAVIPLIVTLLGITFGKDWRPNSRAEYIAFIVTGLAFLGAAFCYKQAQVPIAAQLELGNPENLRKVFKESLESGKKWSTTGFVILLLGLFALAFSMLMALPEKTSADTTETAMVLDSEGVLHCGELTIDQSSKVVLVGDFQPSATNGVKQLWMVKKCPGS